MGGEEEDRERGNGKMEEVDEGSGTGSKGEQKPIQSPAPGLQQLLSALTYLASFYIQAHVLGVARGVHPQCPQKGAPLQSPVPWGRGGKADFSPTLSPAAHRG